MCLAFPSQNGVLSVAFSMPLVLPGTGAFVGGAEEHPDALFRHPASVRQIGQVPLELQGSGVCLLWDQRQAWGCCPASSSGQPLLATFGHISEPWGLVTTCRCPLQLLRGHFAREIAFSLVAFHPCVQGHLTLDTSRNESACSEEEGGELLALETLEY